MQRIKMPGHRTRRTRRTLPLWAGLLIVGTSGCDGFLDVSNPNNIQQEDLRRAEAAAAVANGAFGTVTRGVLAMWGPYSTATDEIFWIGSRDAWQQLDFGFFTDPHNEFTDDAFKPIAQGRWMADEAIEILEDFDQRNEPINRSDLARAYLYGAIAYTTIADQFDRFAFSNRQEAGPVIGPEQMGQLYETAAGYLHKGIAVAQSEGNAGLELTLTAMLARVEYSHALWQKLNPAGQVPSNPLVSDAEATAAAQKALSMLPDADWRFQLDPANTDVAIFGEVSLPYNVNRRLELQFGTDYVELNPEDESKVTGIRIQDPIDNVPDPVVSRKIDEFRAGGQVASFTVVSAREMHLILAEAALADGNLAGFTMHINHVRALDGLTPYAGQIDPLEMLKYERRVNLYLMARRLADLYRFGEQADLWLPTSPAATRPGTFFPITITECRANPNISSCEPIVG